MSAAASSSVHSNSGSSYVRGSALLQECKLERFPYHKRPEPKGQPAHPSLAVARYMRQDLASSAYPKWAPRDCLQSKSATYLEFQQKNLDSYEVALSLIGYTGTDPKLLPVEVQRFARKNYSFLHMPFGKLAEFLTRLHPADRIVAFLLTEESAPVHIYFDLDGAFTKFPHMRNREDDHVSEFIAALACFFERCFGRTMDMSGLLLLQASSSIKMSWHILISSEAFRHMKQLKSFVQQFQTYLEEVHAAMQDEAEAEMSDEPEQSDGPLHLCCFNLTPPLAHSRSQPRPGVAARQPSYVHIVDSAPYSATQNLRAPYNQKPGKTPLLVRHHQWDANGRLVFTPDVDAPRTSDPVIDPNVLFKAHPNLAQPTQPDYSYLTMIDGSVSKRNGLQHQKRKGDTGGTAEISDNPEFVSPTSPTRRQRVDAAGSSVSPSLTGSDQLTIAEVTRLKRLLEPELGPHVAFDELVREVNPATHSSVIKGITQAGTAYCPHLSRLPHAPYTHHSNRIRFRLTEGTQSYRCWGNACKPVHVPWLADSAARQLLDPHTSRGVLPGPTTLKPESSVGALFPSASALNDSKSMRTETDSDHKSELLLADVPNSTSGAGAAASAAVTASADSLEPDSPNLSPAIAGSHLPCWIVLPLDSGYEDEGLRLLRARLELAAEEEHWRNQRQFALEAEKEKRRETIGFEEECKASDVRKDGAIIALGNPTNGASSPAAASPAPLFDWFGVFHSHSSSSMEEFEGGEGMDIDANLPTVMIHSGGKKPHVSIQ